jgi:pyruvate dehydrogenase E1 component alpha subunit
MNDAVKSALYRTMLRIRRVQEHIEALYLLDAMKTPVHLCIGQEAIAAGVCLALGPEDSIQSNHRGHGHYLAKGGSLDALIAELHCKSTGCSGGFGGSMHLVDVSVGHLGSSSIVAGGIPIGTGIGLAMQMRRTNLVSVVFFGDGAADEGVLYESLNFAMLKRLPVVYVLEDNRWAVCSPREARQSGDNVFLRGADPDRLFTARIDGNDALLVHETANVAVARARSGAGPSLLVCDTYRVLGHAGCKAQEPGGYRDASEIEQWTARCPVSRLKARLTAEGVLDAVTEGVIETEIAAEIDAAFTFAVTSPLPRDMDLPKHLFSE